MVARLGRTRRPLLLRWPQQGRECRLSLPETLSGMLARSVCRAQQQFRAGERGVAAEELGDVSIPVAFDHRQQDPSPELGAGVIAPAEQDARQVAELVEQKQGVVAQAGEVAVDDAEWMSGKSRDRLALWS